MASSRRDFLKQTSMAVAGAATIKDFPFVIGERAKPDGPIRVGVIGCGGRGTGAVLNVLQAATHVVYPSSGYHTEDVAEGARASADDIEVIALADVFQDRLDTCRLQIEKLGVKIADDACFVGFDAYKDLLKMDEVNYIIVASPPHFHPIHLLASVEAGKNVFMEKPAAVDGPGIRMVMKAGQVAAEKGLGIVAGTQRRHQEGYVETIKRIQDGAIGEIHTARSYWNGGEIWVIERQDGWSDMEWQMRNWNYFTWLSGDHIVEQHVHNLDVISWVLGDHPISARALGGRLARQHPIHGHIYDHFAVEFEYANGVRMFSQSRQMNNCENMVGEAVLGTKGWSNCANLVEQTETNERWRYRNRNEPNPYEQEHVDLINSIRAGEPINEAQAVAEATLMGIMGRDSAYSGQVVTWDQALNSERDWSPPAYEFGDLPFPEVPKPSNFKII